MSSQFSVSQHLFRIRARFGSFHPLSFHGRREKEIFGCFTNQSESSLDIRLRPCPPLLVHQLELPPDFWLPHALRRFRNPFPLHPIFFEAEIDDHASAGGEEEDGGAGGEGAGICTGAGFFDGFVAPDNIAGSGELLGGGYWLKGLMVVVVVASRGGGAAVEIAEEGARRAFEGLGEGGSWRYRARAKKGTHVDEALKSARLLQSNGCCFLAESLTIPAIFRSG